mmetsp:Transcript_30454/g.65782  ORF Transcript_30454/g.65782 Transcript_30454/m.65782 type:complete len:218 (+) Transcript_30454:229-882(+)
MRFLCRMEDDTARFRSGGISNLTPSADESTPPPLPISASTSCFCRGWCISEESLASALFAVTDAPMTSSLCENLTSSAPILSWFNLHISTFLVKFAPALFSEEVDSSLSVDGFFCTEVLPEVLPAFLAATEGMGDRCASSLLSLLSGPNDEFLCVRLDISVGVVASLDFTCPFLLGGSPLESLTSSPAATSVEVVSPAFTFTSNNGGKLCSLECSDT